MPINYVLTADAVLFRTETDGPLARACRHSVVAFEIDDLATDGHRELSVHLVGFAELVDGQAAVRALHGRMTRPQEDGRDQVVAITLGAINGWDARPAPGAPEGHGLPAPKCEAGRRPDAP